MGRIRIRIRMVSCVEGEGETRPGRVETAWPDLHGPRPAFGDLFLAARNNELTCGGAVSMVSILSPNAAKARRNVTPQRKAAVAGGTLLRRAALEGTGYLPFHTDPTSNFCTQLYS